MTVLAVGVPRPAAAAVSGVPILQGVLPIPSSALGAAVAGLVRVVLSLEAAAPSRAD
jgi:hypothetical protein